MAEAMAEKYDLVIVGGGLGGATLGKGMAEKGARVLILEREKEFKDRVRGEFLAPWGVTEAKKLGVYELLLEEAGHEVPWVDFFSESFLMVHRDVKATTPQQTACMSFYHPEMQEVLLAAAERAGAKVRRGSAFCEVKRGRSVSVVAGKDESSEEMETRLVVGADGRSSSVRTSAGFVTQRDPENMMLAGVLLEDVPAPEDTAHIVLNFRLGQVAVIFPQGGGRARTYFGFHCGRQPRLQGEADWPRYLECCEQTGIRPEMYQGAKPSGPLATFSGAETWVEHPYRDGVALIGDAAAASDPTWGQGLGQTLRDARVLRDCLLATEDWEAAGRAYAEEHDRYSKVIHEVNNWFTEFFLETGQKADERRERALPLIAQDISRQPDAMFSGPDTPTTEAQRRRFFAED
jgi:2-polyprenyl-6-methoxyphenol hydroxylase-like FAD-dependent oxidoreductase